MQQPYPDHAPIAGKPAPTKPRTPVSAGVARDTRQCVGTEPDLWTAAYSSILRTTPPQFT